VPFSSIGIAPVIALSVTLSAAQSSTQEPKKEPTGTVSGRVTLNGKPLPRAVVILGTLPTGPQRNQGIRATTDEDGRYKATRVPAGTYQVMPYALAWVLNSDTFGQPGKSVTLGEGEEVDDIDFSLTKGGVITGRVTDADGKPLISQRVNLMRIDERGQRAYPGSLLSQQLDTDDRGVYRIFGLSAGRYKVSVGDAPNSGIIRVGFGGTTYPQTFYPGVTEESRATIVEVTAGNDSTGIDIVVGRAGRTYSAGGRIVDADTGRPIPNLTYGYGPVLPDRPMIGGFGYTDNRSNANGEFRIEGIAAGRYAAFVVAREETEFYSEAVVFDVVDSDVTGLEIKVRRGATMTGTVVIDGVADAEAAAMLSNLQLRASVRSEDLSPPVAPTIRVGADGSFRVGGLRPGKVMLFVATYPPPKGLTLLRMEREGVEQRDGIAIGPGEAVSGIRVVMGHGTAVLRGQVTVPAGQVTADLRLLVAVRLLSAGNNTTRSTALDARGRFVIEGLIAGEYEVAVRAVPSSRGGDLPGAGIPPAPVRPKLFATQNVTVASGSESQVVINVDLTKPMEDR
ncbi:MAG TPA: carboxypeptidase-like regulatory domain-containing protein, partial [Blastocatellia bacterium]|nr:carboxypeptidase-like regulatory domain-containing protein [Blastocatellia bacterium]